MNSKSEKSPSSCTDSSAPTIVLYSYWQSSCSFRVRFAFRLKGVCFEYKSVNLAKGENLTPEFEILNPLRYVPVLVDGSRLLCDRSGQQYFSKKVVQYYIWRRSIMNPLLPTDPKLKAVNLQIASIVSSSIQPLHTLGILKWFDKKCGLEESLSFAQSIIEKGFHSLEKLVQELGGLYSKGEQLCMADVFLAPQMAVATDRFNVDMSKFPTLDRIFEKYKLLPEFKDSSPQNQPDAEQ